MARNLIKAGVLLLAILAAATACTQPAAQPDPAAEVAVATAMVETGNAVVTAAPVATTEAAQPPAAHPAATDTPVPPGLAVETPERQLAAADPQPAAASGESAPAGPTDEQQWVLDGLPSLGEAPELRNEVWLNSDPLRLADLRGQVVLLDMWTFG